MQTFSSSRKLGFDHGIDLLKLDPYQPPLSNAWLSAVCFTLSWLLPRELVTVTKYSQWCHKSNRRCAHMPFLLNAKFCKHFVWEMLARKWPIIGSKPQACPKAHFSAGLLDQLIPRFYCNPNTCSLGISQNEEVFTRSRTSNHKVFWWWD